MYWVEPNRSLSCGVSVTVFFCSSAQVALAPSTCLRLAMQAFFWLAVRAFTKLGMAIAARRPMMATTIMISTRVNPAFCRLFIFILTLSQRRELTQADTIITVACSRLPCVDRLILFSNVSANFEKRGIAEGQVLGLGKKMVRWETSKSGTLW